MITGVCGISVINVAKEEKDRMKSVKKENWKKYRIIFLMIVLLFVCFYAFFFRVGLIINSSHTPVRITVRDGNTGKVNEIRDSEGFWDELKKAHIIFVHPDSHRSGWDKMIIIEKQNEEIQFIYNGGHIIYNNYVYSIDLKSAEKISGYIVT